MNEIDRIATDFSRIWLSNYLGESEVAKSVESSLKKTYNGAKYLPWATMVRVLYQLDPYAQIIKEQNKDGGFVFTDRVAFDVYKDGQMLTQTALSYMVRITVVFMGKTFEEPYPIQDQKYGAPRLFDQNLVNKALQRGMARCIASATGVGLSLYEMGDLQFEGDSVPTPESTIGTGATGVQGTPMGGTLSATGVIPVDESAVPEDASPLDALAITIFTNRDNPEVKNLIGKYNGVLNTKYQVVIDYDDTVEMLKEKLKDVKNCETMLKGFRKATNAN